MTFYTPWRAGLEQDGPGALTLPGALFSHVHLREPEEAGELKLRHP